MSDVRDGYPEAVEAIVRDVAAKKRVSVCVGINGR